MPQWMERSLTPYLSDLINTVPAVVLTGAPQVGKTTLVHNFESLIPTVYLDLHRPRSQRQVEDIRAYIQLHADKLIILDGIERTPEICSQLRNVINQQSHEENASGKLLLLGSTKLNRICRSNRDMEGMISCCELPALMPHETGKEHLYKLWLRGGYPESYLAKSESDSLDWREAFLQTLLSHEALILSPKIDSAVLFRLAMMIATSQGDLLNNARLAHSLQITAPTVRRYIDLLDEMYLVRILQPWASTQGRRMVKTPKVYIRDSGLCHALCGLDDLDALLGNTTVGGSWEGFVMEYVIAFLSPELPDAKYWFYRTSNGTEINLVAEVNPGLTWAIEIRRSLVPNVSRGFHSACEDLKPARKILIHTGDESYPLNGIECISIYDLHERLIEGV